MTRPRYSIVIVFLSLALVALGNVIYTDRVAQDSDAQWCELLGTLAEPLQTSPAPTERQVRINTQIRAIYGKKCP